MPPALLTDSHQKYQPSGPRNHFRPQRKHHFTRSTNPTRLNPDRPFPSPDLFITPSTPPESFALGPQIFST